MQQLGKILSTLQYFLAMNKYENFKYLLSMHLYMECDALSPHILENAYPKSTNKES